MGRNELDLGRLSQFGSKGQGQDAPGKDERPATEPPATPAAPDQTAAERPGRDWEREAGPPSREPVDEVSVTIRMPRAQAMRFRALAKEERYKLGAFLERLMDHYEDR